MKSPRDDSILPLNPNDARDALSSRARRVNDSDSPSLARWYRGSVREPAERARHLQAISEALAGAERLERAGDERGAVPGLQDTNASAYSRDESLLQKRPAARRGAIGIVRSPWMRAAALVAFATGGISLLAHGRTDAPRTSLDSATREVGFVLRLTDVGVRQVSIAGDFNGWNTDALPMVRDPSDGSWRARVPLAPGRHVYSYVLDGTRWVIDPLAPRTVEGALGPANVIAVAGDT